MTVFGDLPDDDITVAELPKRTGLDFVRSLQAEKRAAQIRTITMRDSQRPEFELVCRVPSDLDEVFGLDKKATEVVAAQPDAPSQEIVLNCMALARYTQVLRVNGMPTTHSPGSPFADPALQEAVGVAGFKGASWRAVRELFIGDGGQYDDGAITRLAQRLQQESGITRDSVVVGEEKDPT